MSVSPNVAAAPPPADPNNSSHLSLDGLRISPLQRVNSAGEEANGDGSPGAAFQPSSSTTSVSGPSDPTSQQWTQPQVPAPNISQQPTHAPGNMSSAAASSPPTPFVPASSFASAPMAGASAPVPGRPMAAGRAFPPAGMTGGGRLPQNVARPPGRPLQGPMGMRPPMGSAATSGQMQTRLPPSLQAKMDKLAAQRSGAPSPTASNGLGPNPQATSMGALLRSQAMRAGGQGGIVQQPGGGGGGGGGMGSGGGVAGPSTMGPNAGPLGLAARRAAAGRPGLSLGAQSAPGGLAAARGGIAGRRGPPGGLTLAQMGASANTADPDHGSGSSGGSKFTDFNTIMDPSGSLKFSKAVLHAGGVDFGDGQSFKINMDEMEVLGELGKGNYGSVQKVFHRPTKVMMAMKEIRLELDESKLNGIIMELDILHRAVAPEIVEFYGAFTIESCVYYCMEFMDAGSLDKLTSSGQTTKSPPGAEDEEPAELLCPEPVLRRITASIVRGLRFLKDELQIMHRDVKPTNVLINTKGEVKLCDFGVSGQLEKSLAKTNIGCQSYMAPERIKGESQNQMSTYTVSSDVWSVGLSIIEIAKGCYPYPPETFANVFAQLTAIVHGPAPTLPKGYSADAQDFVAKCLIKDPNARPTYAQLLEHPFLVADKESDVDMAGWVSTALERQASRGVIPLAEVEA